MDLGEQETEDGLPRPNRVQQPWQSIGEQITNEWCAVGDGSNASRVKYGVRQMLLGWSSPAYTNYLSYVAVNKPPPHGTMQPPHPGRTGSKRDFSKRLQQWRIWLHSYNDTCIEEVVALLQSDDAMLKTVFFKDFERTRSRKRKKQEDPQPLDPNYWRREVVRQTADLDPDFWKAQILHCPQQEEDSDDGAYESGVSSSEAPAGEIAAAVVSSVLDTKDRRLTLHRKRKRSRSADVYIHRSDAALLQLVASSQQPRE
ncbi:hypothetical protein DIPPA_09689 [Diplonema papillatum]|nr:hypothetical protein DIPPA_09689 [Diplonema papillatum]